MRRALAAIAVFGLLAAACTEGRRITTGGDATPSPDTTATGGARPEGGTAPTLTIQSPRTGETVTAPFDVAYEVTGFEVGAGNGFLQMIVAGAENAKPIEIPLTEAKGVVKVGDDKMLTGKRDLTFALAGADHKLLANPEAQVTVRDVIIEGRRSG